MQTEYAYLYVEINLMSIILLAIVLCKSSGISKMVAQRNFAVSIIAEMVFLVSDTAYVMMHTGMLPFIKSAAIAVKEIYFFATAVLCFFCFLYLEYLQDASFAKNRRKIWLSSVCVWLMAILLIVNLFTGILFYLDGDGVYRRGPLFIIQYILSYTYVVVACCRALVGVFQPKRRADQKMLIVLALFPVAPAAAGILQYMYPFLPVACAAISLSTLVLYLNWMGQMISLDPLTKLNNRKQFVYHYELCRKNRGDGIKLFLLLIDANKFKHINDTYGHLQGDLALQRIADAMRLGSRSFSKRVNLARYGGDEFVVLVESEDITMPQALKASIQKTLGELSRSDHSPYEVTVSIGIAQAGENEPFKDVLVRADAEMYKEKHAGGGSA